jgi:hypothetical protein
VHTRKGVHAQNTKYSVDYVHLFIQYSFHDWTFMIQCSFHPR